MDKPKRINRAEDCGWYFDHDYWTDYKDWIKQLKAGDKWKELKTKE
jgi:hypothetical protein